MKQEISKIKKQVHDVVNKVASLDKLEELRIKYLGRKGELAKLRQGLKDFSDKEKKEFGKLFNELKGDIEKQFEYKTSEFERKKWDHVKESEWLDVTEPVINKKKAGHKHPLYVVQEELEDLARAMGFTVLDGPELESDYFNFEALNIPKDHPARDGHDTFYIKDHPDWVMRTQTSNMQIRGMHMFEPPMRLIVPGKVFRNEATDASHDHTFHQLEGVMVDKEISIANLIAVMKELLKGIFKQEVNVRLRPGYFPFVEPGFEMDFACLLCKGNGCSVCSRSGWIEFLGCGLMHPNVVKAGGLDPKKWQAFAFGMGLTRIVMMKYSIDDIRHLSGGDLRFLKQF